MENRKLTLASVFLLLAQVVSAASRTSPPSGSIVVRAGTTTSGEYKTLASAVAALPNDSTSQSIFIYPGTYTEQVYLNRTAPLTIYGYTTDTSSYTSNQVNLQAAVAASTAGGNDKSATLRIHKADFKLYNINVKNTCGKSCGQAVAVSQYGKRVSFYGVGVYGYQDTLLLNFASASVFLHSYIEGATDFIFDAGTAYFGKNTLSVIGPGYVTASGRESADASMYVFENNNVVLGSSASSDTSGSVYLGRPWKDYARVIYKNTVVTATLNKVIWTAWSSSQNLTNVFYADYNTSGSGVSGASRPSWVKTLSASEAATYNISAAVGSDYASWVDATYL